MSSQPIKQVKTNKKMGDVYIVKNQGLGKTTVIDDSVSGMLINGVSIAGGIQENEVYRLKSIEELKKLGVTEDNFYILFRNVQQFFRIAPNAELYLKMVNPNGGGYLDLIKEIPFFVKKCEGNIKQLAVVYNGGEGYYYKIDECVTLAQAQAELCAKEYAYCHIVLGAYGQATPLCFPFAELKNLRKCNAPDVSVMLGVDATYANEMVTFSEDGKEKQKYYSAVDTGIALGAIAKTGVHQSIAHVGTMNLYGQDLTVPAICGGKLVSELSQGEQAEIEDKGYLSFKTYAGRAGIYFNDAATCTALTDDYAYIYTSRTMNKVMRTVRESLLPRINGNIRIDAVTGLIDPLELTELKEEASKGLARMQAFGEISGYDVEINPEQDVIGTGMLYVTIYVVPVGVAKAIKVNVGYKSKLS